MLDISKYPIHYIDSVDYLAHFDAGTNAIYIQSDLEKNDPEFYKISLIHEIAHYLCWNNKCKCMKNLSNHVAAESHALFAEVKFAIDSESRSFKAGIIEHIQSISPEEWPTHAKAADRVKRTKSWKILLNQLN